MAAAPVTVRIRNGVLRGARGSGTVSFKGIPYADTTIGANRFKAPQPVRNWPGERDATTYGSLCPQVDVRMGGSRFAWYNQIDGTSQGEDCCVLNVFTPDLDTAAKRPVMFYIHGGGYINGGSSSVSLDGSHLATFGDVVVVTINHRLNAFGYTNLGHIDPEQFCDSANAGNLDIVAALQWVRDNIAAFGGDPASVTLFGQSGGGSKIMTLLAMPEARGLFHRAISMSGAAGIAVDPAETLEPYADALVKELGGDRKNLAAMQQVPFRTVLGARDRAVTASGTDGARPVVDGKHIVTRPMSPEGLAMQAGIPLLFGTTKTEASLFFQSDMRNFALTEAQMRKRMRTVFKIDDAKIDAIMAAYRKDEPGMTPSQILVAVATDVQFRLPLTGAAETKSAAPGQAPVYMYNFGWTVPWQDGVLGSPHTVDIPFAFGTIDAAAEMTGPGPGPKVTSLNIMAAFVAFARTGNPNNARMPKWEAYDTATRTTMLIDEKCTADPDWRGDALKEISTLKIDPFNRAALYKYEA
ncbi:carboxylesterase/lipase family protein [Novosphingobium sp. AP12]|uniref:carboxylesterase/lipase family protein n=1 Tax=Novosphingobium sp. AP12 TaxID=1144305 RepID=UPI00027200A0|nr:carboxylesterase family protein [Novosphingobium sp. AP12]EJL22724.1 carboxylesterase type B [Novosphingobium sp. AP12]